MSLRSIAGLVLLPILAAACTPGGPAAAGGDSFVRDTGGVLPPEQAAYDVRHYDLAMQVFPERQEIEAVLTATVEAVESLPVLLLDLDPLLEVSAVEVGGRPAAFVHERGRLRIELEPPARAGDTVVAAVHYGGAPRVAPRPPWEGGFVWSRTEDGTPWIATACQMEGADLWWPCKDHPSDKPDSFDLHFRVPDGLVVASNGRRTGIEDHGDGTHTSSWHVSTPIANYCVAFNAGPYVELRREQPSVAGGSFPFVFWALPEHRAQADQAMDEFADHLAWFERYFGPYPFRADKYGVVETPHLGMEHQTIIAYGHGFQGHKYGYDWLHHHELSHEWFANLVTCPDWSDFWIHEGFGSYTQKLYVEDLRGIEAYHSYLADVRGLIRNQKPVAPRGPRSSAWMYFADPGAAEGEKPTDNDIYYKGEWILHTLRWLIGRDLLVESMRRICYPDPALEATTDGSAVHFATTDGYQALVERLSGRDLDWFFELYLRRPELPVLRAEEREGVLRISWETPDGLPFPMPVEVEVGGVRSRIEVPAGGAEVVLPAGATWRVDPDEWILKERAG
ncbi:MAG: M1 family peptidase [Planctomycetota bacterium]|nr:MAG: M1 family peptidase [Planctomycetota bacterium]